VLTPWQWPLLFATGLVAGFVDSIAGGGGMIALPVLLHCGLPPQDALGTNKLQASFGSGSATWHFARAGLVDWRECGRGVALTFLGALAGALTVQHLDPAWLKRVIPALLLAVAIYFFFKPALGEAETRPRLSRGAFDFLFGMGLGFYDGFFGPGVGTFWAMAFVLGLGFHLTKATAQTKAMNFASNVAALGLFLAAGQVMILAGLVMGAGQWLGARLGARLVVKRGTRLIRPIFLTVVVVLTVKLLCDAFVR
jgi:uncharacterized protein